MIHSRRDCDDAVGDDLFRAIGGGQRAIAELTVFIPAHGPKTAVGFDQKRVIKQNKTSADGRTVRRDCRDAIINLFRAEDIAESSIPELPAGVGSHAPESSARFDKQAVRNSGGNTLHRFISVLRRQPGYRENRLRQRHDLFGRRDEAVLNPSPSWPGPLLPMAQRLPSALMKSL